jgi:TonB family protein
MLLLFAGGAVATALEDPSSFRETRRSLRIHQTDPIVYPQVLLDRGVTSGDVRLALSVDHTGALTDLLVVGYSHPEFAAAAERAVARWKFEPMLDQGEPRATRATLAINFAAHGTVVTITPGSDLGIHLLAYRREPAYGPCRAEDLDALPQATTLVSPAYSEELRERGIRGSATVSFYLDENGSVRMAAVREADFWELGVLALDAVKQWKFSPATRHGKPVLVHLEQRFVFGEETN